MENKHHIAVENIVRKGEIACYKQFLLFSQCFLQLYIFSAVLCGNGLTTAFYDDLQISQASSPFHTMFFTP